jgi:mycobactin peptide synthetase MbtE
VAHADLSVNFFGAQGGYRGHLIYRTDLYEQTTARRLADRLVRVLSAFAEDSDQHLRDLRMDPPTAGTDGVYVLDEWLQPVGVGIVGEVYYAADRPGAESGEPDRFVADHLSGQQDSWLYRTGERGRWRTDGQLEFIQETPLRNGASRPAVAEPARTDTERTLVALLTEVLDTDRGTEIGRNDDYFSLGGDSIKAVQVAARARDAGLRLTARMVFEHPTVHELASVLDGLADSGPQPGDAHHEPMSVSGLSADDLAELTASWTAAQEMP